MLEGPLARHKGAKLATGSNLEELVVEDLVVGLDARLHLQRDARSLIDDNKAVASRGVGADDGSSVCPKWQSRLDRSIGADAEEAAVRGKHRRSVGRSQIGSAVNRDVEAGVLGVSGGEQLALVEHVALGIIAFKLAHVDT